MRYKEILLFSVFYLFVFVSCEDVFLRDLEGKRVSIISPPDSLHSAILSQTFWWNTIDETESYRFQLVEGSFDYPLKLVSDTLVVNDKFELSLNPGIYQWRVRPENNGSHGVYTLQTIFIDSTYNLSNQQVILSSPSNYLITNSGNQQFSWQSLYNATEYRFQIIDLADNSIIKDEITTTTAINYQLNEGSFQWQVRAQNEISVTGYSQRTITVDISAPSIPFNLSPLNNSFVNNGDTLFWSVDSSSHGDSVYISMDTLFVSPAPFKIFTYQTYYKINLTNGSYYWKVRSIDEAGNISPFTIPQKFTVL